MRSSTSKSTFIGKNQVLQQKTTPSDIGHDDLKSIMSIIRAKKLMSLFLEELVAHGEEGDGEAGAEEDDEVEGQLVPGGKIEIKLLPGEKCQSTSGGDRTAVDFVELKLEAPVVDREGEVVARSWEAITTASRMG